VLIFYVVVSIASWAALYPMLRAPRLVLAASPLAADVPVVTFDSRGFA
jgi:hypothetical protein